MIQTRLATPLVTRVMLLMLPMLIVAKATVFSGLTAIKKTELTDFDAFHIVGQMVWRGDVAEAYRLETMMRAQSELGGMQSAMPWTYPPPFDLVVAPLACLPIGLAYLLFTGLTLGAFLLVLRRIADESFPAVLLAIYPAIVVTIGCGQNGFLTGTLIGLAALALDQGRAVAGIPLGLMVIKPHLAVAFALHAFAGQRWACIGVAVAVAAAACGVATVILGPAIWPAFHQGVAEAKAFLVAGLYPFHRMVSVYSVLRGLGVPAGAALAAQAVVALGALSLVVLAIRRGLPPRHVLGFTALASLLVSPYAYDYDLSIFGIGLAFLMPGLIRWGTAREQLAITGLSLAAAGYGLVSTFSVDVGRILAQGGDATAISAGQPGIAGAVLPLILVVLWRILGRDPQAVAGNHGTAQHHAAVGRMVPARRRDVIAVVMERLSRRDEQAGRSARAMASQDRAS